MPKFVHIRKIDEFGTLLPTGGLTVAYSLVPWVGDNEYDIVFNVAMCSVKDLYCHKTGREVAVERLNKTGPLDVVPGNEHPRAQMIVDWLAANYDPRGVITITRNNVSPRRKFKDGSMCPRYRWVSTFLPRNPNAI